MTSHTIESRRAFLKTTVVAGAALAGNATLSNATQLPRTTTPLRPASSKSRSPDTDTTASRR